MPLRRPTDSKWPTNIPILVTGCLAAPFLAPAPPLAAILIYTQKYTLTAPGTLTTQSPPRRPRPAPSSCFRIKCYHPPTCLLPFPPFYTQKYTLTAPGTRTTRSPPRRRCPAPTSCFRIKCYHPITCLLPFPPFYTQKYYNDGTWYATNPKPAQAALSRTNIMATGVTTVTLETLSTARLVELRSMRDSMLGIVLPPPTSHYQPKTLLQLVRAPDEGSGCPAGMGQG